MRNRSWLRKLSRTGWRRGGRDVWPWGSPEERKDTLALGRQAITLMTCGVLIASGHLSGHAELGYLGAAWAFQAGALWVWLIDHPRKPLSPPARQSRRPFDPPVP